MSHRRLIEKQPCVRKTVDPVICVSVNICILFFVVASPLLLLDAPGDRYALNINVTDGYELVCTT